MNLCVVRLPKIYLKGVYLKGILIMSLKDVKYPFEKRSNTLLKTKGGAVFVLKNKGDYDIEIL